MLKRLISIAVSAAIAVTLIPSTVSAESSGACGDNAVWTINSGCLTIDGSGSIADYTSYEETPWCDEEIYSVTLSEDITGIGSYAFYGCSKLSAILLPESVTYIGENAVSAQTDLIRAGNKEVVSINGYPLKDAAARAAAARAEAKAEEALHIAGNSGSTEINDKNSSDTTTYSSEKINTLLGNLGSLSGYLEGTSGSVQEEYLQIPNQLGLPSWFGANTSKLNWARGYNIKALLAASPTNSIDRIGVYIPLLKSYFTNNPDVKSVHATLFAATEEETVTYGSSFSSSIIATQEYDLTDEGLYNLNTSGLDFSQIDRLYIGYVINYIQLTDGTQTSYAGRDLVKPIYASQSSLTANEYYGDTKYYCSLNTSKSMSLTWTAQTDPNSTVNMSYAVFYYYRKADLSNISKDVNVAALLQRALEGGSQGSSTTQPSTGGPLDTLRSDGGMMRIFKSVSCIGDSLTSGVCEFKDENGKNNAATSFPEYAYPTQMSRALGISCKNLGAGGRCAANKSEEQLANGTSKYNVLSWLYNARNVKEYWHDNDTDKADAYIVALGTNDIANYGSFTGDLSTDVSIDTTARTITVKDNTTSVGGYCEILNTITAVQPRARIFCVTLPNTRESDTARSEMNTKIKAIADAYQSIGVYIYVIDLETYGIQKADAASWKSVYYSGGHLNPLGYKWLSDAYMTYIDYIITQNPQDFNAIHIADDTGKNKR